MKNDIVIAGVGGQGVIFTSRLIAHAAIKMGWHVRTSETLGMAQRGGAVVSHVRINNGTGNPIIPKGQADLLLGLELIETARHLNRLNLHGHCLMFNETIYPFAYSKQRNIIKPEEIISKIKRATNHVVFVDSPAEIDLKMRNVYLMGVVLRHRLLPIPQQTMEKSLIELLASEHVEQNLQVFCRGLSIKDFLHR